MWVYVRHKKNVVTLTACNIWIVKIQLCFAVEMKRSKAMRKSQIFVFLVFTDRCDSRESNKTWTGQRTLDAGVSVVTSEIWKRSQGLCAFNNFTKADSAPSRPSRSGTNRLWQWTHHISHWLHLLAVMHCTWSRLHPFLVKQFNFLDIVHCGRTFKTVSAFSEKQGSLCS